MALDLQDTRQGGKPEADRADRELGPAPFRRGVFGFGAQETPRAGSVLRGVLDNPKSHLLLKCGPWARSPASPGSMLIKTFPPPERSTPAWDSSLMRSEAVARGKDPLPQEVALQEGRGHWP